MNKLTTKNKAAIYLCIAATAINLGLFFVKLYIGITSGSLCIFIDSINNLFDCFTCIIAVVGFSVMSMKPNKKYPFGMGRAEDIVSFLMSMIIIITGLAFAYSSLQRFMYPTPIWFSVKYVVILSMTVVVKLFMAFLFRFYYKRINSPIIAEIRLDSLLDAFISVATITSFTLSEYVRFSVDGLFGMIISVIIVIEGIKFIYSAVGKLMGKNDTHSIEQAESIVLNTLGVKDIKLLNCHSYGDEKVFNAIIITDFDSVDKIEEMKKTIIKKVSDELSAQIIISTWRMSK